MCIESQLNERRRSDARRRVTGRRAVSQRGLEGGRALAGCRGLYRLSRAIQAHTPPFFLEVGGGPVAAAHKMRRMRWHSMSAGGGMCGVHMYTTGHAMPMISSLEPTMGASSSLTHCPLPIANARARPDAQCGLS